MKISLIQIGQTNSSELKSLCQEYLTRLKNYISIEVTTVADVKGATKMDPKTLRKREWDLIKSKIPVGAEIILLDDKGKEFSSVEFSSFLQKKQNASVKNLVFIIGGAFGFDEDAYSVASSKLSLSRLTFSHQMVRLIFLEQLYRGFSILKGEKYHHE